jgi:hypothetical protein
MTGDDGTSSGDPGYDFGVPLSEDEERILHEIEEQLHATDPQLVREVSSTTLYRHAGRNLKWATLGFVVGLVFMVLTFTQSTPAGVVGFLAMLASAIAFERNLRKMGKAGWREWTQSVGASGMREYFGNASIKMKDRFKRDEQ